jgi:long-chain acyl-CoA synthetase
VAQIYVHGDSLQSELVAIVVPDQEFCLGFAVKNKLLPANTILPPPPVVGQPPHPLLVELSKNSAFQKLIFDDITALGKQEKLRGFEFVKAIHIQAEMFSAENGLLTPTFKLKRADAAIKFRPEIDSMYKELNASKPPAKL